MWGKSALPYIPRRFDRCTHCELTADPPSEWPYDLVWGDRCIKCCHYYCRRCLDPVTSLCPYDTEMRAEPVERDAKCGAPIVSGKRKGQVCGRTAVLERFGDPLCLTHDTARLRDLELRICGASDLRAEALDNILADPATVNIEKTLMFMKAEKAVRRRKRRAVLRASTDGSPADPPPSSSPEVPASDSAL